ncbi:hypothetical protein T484DRAFT_1862047 [Baffinella frigidus]|nr:hypothetical protein T484DRAFT_1862047 [Cryptophyta sp. CCMP2293]
MHTRMKAALAASIEEEMEVAAAFLLARGPPPRPRHYMTCSTLQAPNNSAYTKIMSAESGQQKDMAMMKLTAFDEETFDEILVAFEPHWERVTAELNVARRVKKGLDAVGGAGGRPRDLDAHGALAVTLASLHLVANQKSLEMIFGLVQSTVTNYTQPGRAALLRATKDLPALYAILRDPAKCPPWAQLAADAAFSASPAISAGRIVKPLRRSQLNNIAAGNISHANLLKMIKRHRAVTSSRQSVLP